MGKWIVISQEGNEAVRLERTIIEGMTIKVGDWIDFKPSTKWNGANNGLVKSIGPNGMEVDARIIRMRRGGHGAFDVRATIGLVNVPYSAVKELAN